jgi:hypothetical protein
MSTSAGIVKANVLGADGYISEMIQVHSLSAFLLTTFPNKTDLIDYLWLDIEGPEYRILPQFANGEAMTRTRTVCQINVELHGTLDWYNMTLDAFYTLSKNLFTHTDYLPIHISAFNGVHHRLMMFNWRAHACVNKYVLL